MLYSNSPRVHYDKAQLAEVICQLRFPAILTIDTQEVSGTFEILRALGNA